MVTKDKILLKIKEFDLELYNQIINQNISDDLLLDNIAEINQYISDLNENKQIIREIKLVNGRFINSIKYLNPEDERANVMKIIDANFKFHYGIESIKEMFFSREFNLFQQNYEFLKTQNINNSQLQLIEKYKYFLEELKNNSKGNLSFVFASNKIKDINLTNIAIGYLKRIALHKSVGYLSIEIFYSDVKLNFDSKSIDLKVLSNEFKSVDYLILDDFKIEILKKWFLTDFIFPILEYRKKNSKQTSFILEQNLKDFIDSLMKTDLLNSDIEKIETYLNQTTLKFQ